MSEITWEALNRVEQDALKFAVENKFVRGVSKSIRDFDEWTFACTNRLHGWGLLEPFISDSAPDPEYTLYKPTAKGRALLIPATAAPTDELARLQAENARLREALEAHELRQRCRQEGWQARIAGEEGHANPYPWGTEESRHWQDGWFENAMIRIWKRKARLAQWLTVTIRNEREARKALEGGE